MKQGILLVQLGSPKSASVEDVRQYLIEFLGDLLVVQPRPPFWNLLLRFIVAPRRAPRSALLYQEMLDRSGSTEMPLITHTRQFSEKVQSQLGNDHPVAHCFQYGSSPTPREALAQLAQAGCTDIQVIPLYPQRAGATTEAAKAGILETGRTWNGPPSLPRLHIHSEGFATQEFWVQAIVRTLVAELGTLAMPPSDIVFSLHGYPVSRIQDGDPYQADCEASVKAIQKALQSKRLLPPETQFHIAYQSRFGRQNWLTPSTSDMLHSLGEQHASVLVISPAFTVDNLETLVEIDRELRDEFFHAGGRAWQRVPCLNDEETWTRDFAEWAKSLSSSYGI